MNFTNKYKDIQHLQSHKIKIAEFWWVVLGGKPKAFYKYDPVSKHLAAGFSDKLLADWKSLFKNVLDDHLDQEKSYKWYQRVQMIGSNLLSQDQRLRHEFVLSTKL